jgi:S1-C subfamily serine protease
MRRALSWLTIFILALAGCTAPRSRPAADQLAWQRLCAHMQPAPENPAPSAAGPQDTAQGRALEAAATRARPAVVHIHTIMVEAAAPATEGDAARLGRRSGGTGVIVGADGLIVTAAHVVRGAQAVRVVLADGTSYPAHAVEFDPHRDVAIVSIDAHDLPTLPPETAAAPHGTPIVALGCPGPAVAARRFGRVSKPCASLQHQLDPAGACDFPKLIEPTAALEPGFSGGPLLDQHGHLLGLHVAMRGNTPERRRGYAQPLDIATLAELSARIRGR